MRSQIPKIIWVLWLQGWDRAPPVAHASLASWQRRNRDWRVHALDRHSLREFIPDADLDRIMKTPKQPEATSDQCRFELLFRHGGVWVDATTICAKPLDDWLDDVAGSGFFAFAEPTPDRMIATWFLAAAVGSCIVDTWRAASVEYWTGRELRDDYFWPHRLFAAAYHSDAAFRAAWDATPKRAASHSLHFGPSSTALLDPPTRAYERSLENPPVPVIKLTSKLDRPYNSTSLMAVICAWGRT